MKIDVKTDFLGAFRTLDVGDKQIRYAAAVALTRTAKIAEREVKATMRTVFDRPTPYAIGATRLIPATKANLTSQVWLKDRRGRPASKDTSYLVPEIFGGPRGRKAFETALLKAGVRSNEFLVPAEGAPLDAFGNVPPSVIRQMLSGLQAAENSAGYNANVRRGAAQGAQGRRRQAKAGTFFIPPAGGPLPRGIYQRKRTGFGWATRMLFAIVVGKPRYRARLRIGEIARRIAAAHFAREFETAYNAALATAR